MAFVRVFYLLATLAIAAANPSAGYAGDQPEKKPYLMPKSEAKPKTDEHDTTNPSCGVLSPAARFAAQQRSRRALDHATPPALTHTRTRRI
jgi:hypothetical protein